jgi:hypothetical protein
MDEKGSEQRGKDVGGLHMRILVTGSGGEEKQQTPGTYKIFSKDGRCHQEKENCKAKELRQV